MAPRASARLGGVVGEPSEAGFAIGDDGREWLIDLMGNRGGQFAECGDARHMSKLGLRALQRLLRQLGVGHVHQRADIFKSVRRVAGGMGHAREYA